MAKTEELILDAPMSPAWILPSQSDDQIADVILDRLLHHCEVIAINGPSYRLKNRLAAVTTEIAATG